MRTRVMLGLLIPAAGGLTVAAVLTERLPGDRAVTLWVQQGPLNGLFGWVSRSVAAVDQYKIIAVGVAAGAILVVRRRLVLAASLMPVMGMTFLAPLLKEVVERPRPSADLVAVMPQVEDDGFPSGHVFYAMLVFGALFVHAREIFGPDRRVVLAARCALVLGTIGVGLSRIYRGARWTSDIVGACLVGGLILFGTITAYQRFAAPRLASALARLQRAGIAHSTGAGAPGEHE